MQSIPKIASEVLAPSADAEAFQDNNQLALAMIQNENFDHAAVNDLFNGLGVEYMNDEGLKGIYKKRMETLQQYFTPTPISELLVKVLQIPKTATVLDNCCGSGRMFYHLPNKRLVTGIELDDYCR